MQNTRKSLTTLGFLSNRTPTAKSYSLRINTLTPSTWSNKPRRFKTTPSSKEETFSRYWILRICHLHKWYHDWKFYRKKVKEVLLQSWPKYMRQTLVLIRNRALREKFNFNFWTAFRLYWQTFPLRAPIFKNIHLVAEIYFLFLKTCPRSNFKSLQ